MYLLASIPVYCVCVRALQYADISLLANAAFMLSVARFNGVAALEWGSAVVASEDTCPINENKSVVLTAVSQVKRKSLFYFCNL